MARAPRTQKVDVIRAKGKAAVAREFFREVAAVRRQRWGNLWGYFFITPAVIMYIVFQFWPIVRGLFMAFSDYRWIHPQLNGDRIGKIQSRISAAVNEITIAIKFQSISDLSRDYLRIA